MIARNEERDLRACLKSVAHLVDEIVVTDVGLDDNTKAVAASFGARVVDFAWSDDWSAARNQGLRQATGAWIFWLDADERLDAENQRRLRELFAGLKDENVAYAMMQLSRPQTTTGVAIQVEQVRLFRNHPEIHWQYRLHNQILPALRRHGTEVRQTEITIEHLGFQDESVVSAKLERNLRILRLEQAERPDDPFTLFNLGFCHLDLGRAGEAVPLLRRSLELADPSAPYLRKLFAILARAQARLGQRAEAFATLRSGQARFAEDPELLFVEGVLRAEQGDLAQAEACLVRLLQSRRVPGLATNVHPGLRGYLGRHYLAGVYCAQGRIADAEAEWRKALAHWPNFTPAWRGLGELYAHQGRWDEFAKVVERMKADPQAQLDGAVLQAEGHLAREEYLAARQTLSAVIETAPQALWPREVLSRTLLREGNDWAAAESALRAVLAIEPNHPEARHNLALLLQQPSSAHKNKSKPPAANGIRPPSPPGHFLGGNSPEYKRDPLGFLTRCARAYGDIVALRFGRQRVWLLNHPDHIEYVLVTGHRNFTRCSRGDPIFGKGLFTSEGDFWLRQRRLAQLSFQRQRLAIHGATVVALTQRMLATWQDGQTRDLHEEMMRLMLEIAAKTILGIDLPEEAHNFGRTLETALKCIEGRSGRWQRLAGWLPTPNQVRLWRAIHRLDTILYRLIEQRRTGGEGRDDLLSSLLHARLEQDGSRMTDRQLRDEAMNLFVAGRETTALALSWTWYLLARHPGAMAELETELQAVLGGRAPTVADLPQLRYTECVVLESLRLFPPACALRRKALEGCEIGSYHVPAGTLLLLLPWVLHRDPRYFSNPDEFQPNRWADGLAQRLLKCAYIPFGAGPRHCIGHPFAMMIAVLALATIAQQFRVALVPGYTLKLWANVTLKPWGGIQAVLSARRQVAGPSGKQNICTYGETAPDLAPHDCKK
jgi:cytochrome P450/tetratricopeptide (TPR) repeat protein